MKRISNILLLVITVIVTLLLFEVIIRVFHLVPDTEDISTEGLVFSTNPKLRYTMKPNGRWLHHGTVININESGYRGKVIDPDDKPPDTIRIIVIGDSITLGLYLNEEDTYCRQLEDLLNEKKLFGKKWEVINFGVNGYNTVNEVELLKVNGMKYHPDLILLQYCYNDHDNKSELDMRMKRALIANHKLIYLLLNPSLKFFRKSKLFLFCALRLNLCRANMNDAARIGTDYNYQGDCVALGLSELRSLIDREGISTLVLIFPRFEKSKRRFSQYGLKYDHVEKICQENGLPYLNLLDYFITYHSEEDTFPDFHIDSCHPTAYGSKIVAEAVINKLQIIGSGFLPEGESNINAVEIKR